VANPSPLADLSYRGYEDARGPRGMRWSVVARQTMREAFARRPYWILMVLCSGQYLILMAVAYFLENIGAEFGQSGVSERFFNSIVWRDEFLRGYGFGHLMMMAILLIVGAGSVSNDHRANALLMIFSKPFGKLDYLVGKIVGVATPVFMALAIPGTIFYIYGALNFRPYGFISVDPLMLPKLLLLWSVMSLVMAIHVVGLSACFREGRLAGAAYAGLYILSGLFASFAQGARRSGQVPEALEGALLNLHYVSLYGINDALMKFGLNTDGSIPFGSQNAQIIPRPPVALLGAMLVVTLGLALYGAWRRIRAVEVVG
jgi:ABC-2 type transport system permease protein